MNYTAIALKILDFLFLKFHNQNKKISALTVNLTKNQNRLKEQDRMPEGFRNQQQDGLFSAVSVRMDFEAMASPTVTMTPFIFI
jgi:hypothetical protein